MDRNQKKELFSRAFVKAIAAQVGFRTMTPDVDDDSIDILIKGRGYIAPIRNPQLEVQLKCTATDDDNPDFLKFNLSIKNYNDLRGDDILSPRYLFVVVVPKEPKDWLSHEPRFTIFQHCCYWMSIKDYPETTNTTSVTIDIPKAQVLNAESMQSLMEMASMWEVA
ncbi:TPA: DUF4365 domain-containing protein [Aeromonas hydrophila]